MNDPIVEEVRTARDNHARRFNYDLSAICEDIRRHQENCGHPVVTLRRKNKECGSDCSKAKSNQSLDCST